MKKENFKLLFIAVALLINACKKEKIRKTYTKIITAPGPEDIVLDKVNNRMLVSCDERRDGFPARGEIQQISLLSDTSIGLPLINLPAMPFILDNVFLFFNEPSGRISYVNKAKFLEVARYNLLFSWYNPFGNAMALSTFFQLVFPSQKTTEPAFGLVSNSVISGEFLSFEK